MKCSLLIVVIGLAMALGAVAGVTNVSAGLPDGFVAASNAGGVMTITEVKDWTLSPDVEEGISNRASVCLVCRVDGVEVTRTLVVRRAGPKLDLIRVKNLTLHYSERGVIFRDVTAAHDRVGEQPFEEFAPDLSATQLKRMVAAKDAVIELGKRTYHIPQEALKRWSTLLPYLPPPRKKVGTLPLKEGRQG